jgi:tetratricopeptide (TPR) repeat protein
MLIAFPVLRHPWCMFLLQVMLATLPLTASAQENLATFRGETSKRVPVAESGKTRAVIVGISSYTNLPKDKQLDFADDDAELFHTWLSISKPLADVEVFIDKEATANKILLSIDEMIKESVAGDELIFYFAGHGDVSKDKTKDQDDAYLLCTNVSTDADYALSDAISLSRLQTLIATAAKSGVRINLITDACRSGKVATSEEAAYSTAYLLSQKWDKVMKLASCQENELSYEHIKWGNGHGAFTYYLIRGLSRDADVAPKDNFISLNELELYLKKEVPAATDYIQNPIKLGGDARAIFGASLKEDLIDQTVYLPKVQVVLAQRAGDNVSYFDSPVLNELFKQFREYCRDGKLTDSAFLSYQKFVETATDVLTERKIKNELILQLVTSTQKILDKYMEGGNDMPSAAAFEKAAQELELAIKLYDRNNSISQHWRSELLFLKAFVHIRAERREKYNEAKQLLTRALKGNKKAAYIYQAMGRMYNNMEEYQLAEKYLLKAIELAPRWTYARSDLGNTYNDLNRWEESTRQFEETIRLDPTLAKAYNNLSNNYYEQGKLSKSEKLYLKADSLAPNTAVYFANLANVYVKQGRIEKGMSMYEKARQADSNFYWTYAGLADYYMYQSQDYGRIGKAITYLRKAQQLEPYYSYPYRSLGNYYFKFNSTKEDLVYAEKMLRKAIELNPHDRASYYDLSFYQLATLKDTAAAVKSIQSMMKNNKGSGEAYYYKGCHEIDMDDPKQAEIDLRKALQIDPFIRDAYTQLSKLMEKQKRNVEAEAILLQTLERFPESPEITYNIANFYLRQRRTDNAVEFYKRSLQIDTSFSYAWSSLAYILLRNTLDAKDARIAFEKAMALNPFLHKPAAFAGLIRMKADSLTVAGATISSIVSFYDEALYLDPSKADVINIEIARLHYLDGNLDKAKLALEKITSSAGYNTRQTALNIQWKIKLQEGDLQTAYALIEKEMSEQQFPSYLGKAIYHYLKKESKEAAELVKLEHAENPANFHPSFLQKNFNKFLLNIINTIDK